MRQRRFRSPRLSTSAAPHATSPLVLQKDTRSIQTMFAKIAHRYDRANHVLSFQVDNYWRRVVSRRILPSPGRVLDVASGTGDLAVALARRGHKVTSTDFTFEMLAEGQAKLRKHARGTVQLTADALSLPFHAETFDAVTVAFGIRNFADPLAGLRDMTRVIRHGGRVAVLEFSRPSGPFGAAFQLYSSRILPAIGGFITGHREPYEYLPRSVAEFPEGDAFLALMRDAGLEHTEATRLTGGIASLYLGVKP